MTPLQQALHTFFTDWLATSDTGKGKLAQAVAAMSQQTAVFPIPNHAPNHTPAVVTRWLPTALQNQTAPHCAPLLNALATSHPQLHWQTKPASYMGQPFSTSFAFTELITNSLHEGDDSTAPAFKAGLALLAPHSFHPPHQKQAAEFCGILSGLAQWQIYYNPPVYHPAGAHIFHPPLAEHAQQTADEPLLTVWLWIGDLAPPTALQQAGWL